jgi:hypothetical protein
MTNPWIRGGLRVLGTYGLFFVVAPAVAAALLWIALP